MVVNSEIMAPVLWLVTVGLLSPSAQSGSAGAGPTKPATKPAEDKRIEREKGYHYARPKNTGPTPESARDGSSNRNTNSQKKSDLDATAPPSRTPQTKSPTARP